MQRSLTRAGTYHTRAGWRIFVRASSSRGRLFKEKRSLTGMGLGRSSFLCFRGVDAQPLNLHPSQRVASLGFFPLGHGL
jgi:hypothetical protein